MKKAVGLALLGVLVGLLPQACGSSDSKKTARSPYDGGGQGGEGGEATPNPSGGEAVGGGGSPGVVTPVGGAGGEGVSGGAGGTSSLECPTGFAECDGDSSESCEQDLSDLANCGACGTECTNDHGAVACLQAACAPTCDDGYADCNGDPNDGCETSLEDDEHCGACGNDCTSVGATCDVLTRQGFPDVDTCGDIRVHDNVPIAPGGGFNANAWAFSEKHGVFHMTKTNGILRRFPLDGSAYKTIWDNGNLSTAGNESIVVDGDDVLWSQYGTPSVVRRKAIAAAEAALPTDAFFPEYCPAYLRLQGDYYYWISGENGEPGYIYRRLRTAAQAEKGSRIVNVAQGSSASISGFAVTTDAIYWITGDDLNAATTDNDIRTVPLTGGTPTSVPAVPGAVDGTVKDFGNATMSIHLTAVGDTMYFARTIGDSTLNGVYRFKKGDATPTKLVEAENVTTFAVGPHHIYYGLLLSPGIWSAPLAGGQGVQKSEDYVTRALGTDDKFVYVAFTNTPAYIYKQFQ